MVIYLKTLKEIDGITGLNDFGTLAASGENGGCGKFDQWPLPVGMSAPVFEYNL